MARVTHTCLAAGRAHRCQTPRNRLQSSLIKSETCGPPVALPALGPLPRTRQSASAEKNVHRGSGGLNKSPLRTCRAEEQCQVNELSGDVRGEACEQANAAEAWRGCEGASASGTPAFTIAAQQDGGPAG